MKSLSAVGGLLLLWTGLACGQTNSAPSALASQQALVSKYCAGCHNDKLKSGGFSWAKLDLSHPDQNAEQAEKVIRKLRAGMMPPAGMPRPDPTAVRTFAAFIENGLDQAAAARPNPGRPALHRLNRTEYANSVHDLLGVDVDVSALLPSDDMSHGFDNMADALTVSPALMDAYIRAAGKISRQALGDPGASPSVMTYQMTKAEGQWRHVDGAPLGTRGGMSVVYDFPADGDYTFKITFYYSIDGPLFGKSMGKGQQIEVSVNGERVALFDIDPQRTKWDDLQTPPIKVKAGPQRVSAAFIQNFEGPVEDIVMPVEQGLVDLNKADFPGMTSLPHLHDLAIAGPFKVTGVSDTPSRRKILVCRPATEAEELPCAKKIISTLTRQAWRRPVNDSDLEDLLTLYQTGRNKEGFNAGIQMAVQAVLSDPEFVFRFERVPAGVAAGKIYRISDLELASRLSYFLWSSAPDDQLISLASQNRLRDPATLERQVRRMLADPRSAALSTNFAAQWLHLQNLKDVQPDAYQFPNYTRNLGQSMARETELLFDSVMREDRNVVDLLTADYTFVDELLAKHYGLPNVLGTRFRRVPVTDPNRRGLLGQGSILTLTSVSNRTSPVIRGKYVMAVLLGTPPPVPPPNVPPLKENAPSGSVKMQSVRERLEAHRVNEPCRSCHQMMDPIGFALENFDGVGQWRTNELGLNIDATGTMFDGAKLDGPAGLRQAILNHSDSFIGGFTENLLAYGIGRVLESSDMPMVRAIDRDAARNGNRFSSYILGIVRSGPFLTSRVDPAAQQSAANQTVAGKETKTNVHH
jgi:hypothetical protein